jgi:hypothetical protein
MVQLDSGTTTEAMRAKKAILGVGILRLPDHIEVSFRAKAGTPPPF